MPGRITAGLRAALEQAEAEGQPMAEIAEAAAQGAEITTELNGQELTITAHETENMEAAFNVNRRTPQSAGRGRQGLHRRACCVSERTQLRLCHRRLHGQQDRHGIRPGERSSHGRTECEGLHYRLKIIFPRIGGVFMSETEGCTISQKLGAKSRNRPFS